MKQVLFPLVCIMFFNSCHKECNDIVNYVFELPATLSPAKDTYRIGDTITIVSEFSDVVFDRTTKKKFKLEGWKFYPETIIVRIDDTTVTTDNFSEFKYLVDTAYNYKLFEYSNGSRSLVGQYTYVNNKYILKYKIIPVKEGIFFFKHGSGLYSYGKTQDIEGRCPKGKAGIDAFVNLNNGADNHIHLLSTSPDEHYNHWVLINPQDRFYKWGGYCFYVKD